MRTRDVHLMADIIAQLEGLLVREQDMMEGAALDWYLNQGLTAVIADTIAQLEGLLVHEQDKMEGVALDWYLNQGLTAIIANLKTRIQSVNAEVEERTTT